MKIGLNVNQKFKPKKLNLKRNLTPRASTSSVCLHQPPPSPDL